MSAPPLPLAPASPALLSLSILLLHPGIVDGNTSASALISAYIWLLLHTEQQLDRKAYCLLHQWWYADFRLLLALHVCSMQVASCTAKRCDELQMLSPQQILYYTNLNRSLHHHDLSFGVA